MKASPVGVELFHADRRADGRTDMTKLMVTFRNFANVHNIDTALNIFPP